MGNKYKLGKTCEICGVKILDDNKSNRCRIHRDYSGKNNSFYGKKHNQNTINRIKATTMKSLTELWKNESYRKKVIDGISKPRSEIGKYNISVGIKNSYDTCKGLRKLRADKMKKYWKEGKITKGNYSCNKSKIQSKLYEDIKFLFPNNIVKEDETIHFGDKWLFPDIIITDLKIIIEFYGDYWHANPKKYLMTDKILHTLASDIWKRDAERKNIFESMGYTVIEVWQTEYKKNKENLLNSIKGKIDAIRN